jgi:hypothetical protein
VSGEDKLNAARRAYARFGYVPIFVTLVAAGGTGSLLPVF